MDRRESYINQVWRAYPALQIEVYSVAQAIRTGAEKSICWLGGRIAAISGQSLELESQGCHVTVDLQDAKMAGTATSGVFDEPDFAPREVLQPGDKVVVEVRKTDRGHRAVRIVLAAPALAPAPMSPLTLERARGWQQFLSAVREFFVERGFCHVETPSLVVCPGMEPTLEPFSTELRWGRQVHKVCLPTSPELHLKKLLSRGWSEIFEIRSCFRNDEVSPLHEPEFTMLEWYRAYADLRPIARDLEELLGKLAACGLLEGALKPVRRMTVAEAFAQAAGMGLTPATSRQELLQEARRLGHRVEADEAWNDLFHRIFVAQVEPWLAEREEPVLLGSWPPSQAALARLTPEGWADRIELYWRGLEIANGFSELNDPSEQRRRFAADLEERRRLGRTEVPVDEEFLQALDAGLPPSGGIALGLERLFVACQNMAEIQSLKAFPWSDRLTH